MVIRFESASLDCGHITAIDVAREPDSSSPLIQLLRRRVEDITVDKSGKLRLFFEGAALLEIPAHPSFEACDITSGRSKVVAMPGGEVALW
jgi:hypothetical protein